MSIIQDSGLVIGLRNYQEEGMVIKILTKEYGIINFLNKRISKKQRPILQIGNLLNCQFWLKTGQQLAISQKYELDRSYSSLIILESSKITLLKRINNVIDLMLPEGEANLTIFKYTCEFLEELVEKSCFISYNQSFINWQLLMLKELGFSLDLSCCAVTQATENLHYISPKTGRAVCYEVGNKYHDKLFLIPKFLLQNNHSSSIDEIKSALNITEFFFRKVFNEHKVAKSKQQY
jgi:DNA repair protein RecO (recombination protein O)